MAKTGFYPPAGRAGRAAGPLALALWLCISLLQAKNPVDFTEKGYHARHV
jgi:hypothetical protein